VRIALVSQEYPPETAKGGLGTQTRLKASGLAALGHEVHVISRSTDSRRREHQDGAVRVTRIPGLDEYLSVYTEPVRWLTYSIAVAAAVADLHERAPLDLVDFPDWGCEAYVHLLNRTEWQHVRTVIHLHGPLVMFAHAIGWPTIDSEFYRVGTQMEATCLRLADAVFSSSACSAEWCARHYGLPRERIPVIHAGIDTRLFATRDVRKAERPTILFVGSIVRNKGVDFLVDAACRLAAEIPDLRVRLIGRGEPELIEQLRARAAPLPDLLEFPGYIANEELATELSRAHVFAAPSVYEGGPGFVYLEAMACGLPVVGCAGSGAGEVVTDGETGLLVPPGDAGALTNVLRRLLTDSTLRDKLGARARMYVQAEASSDVCARRIEALYRAVVDGRDLHALGAPSDDRIHATR
jgi:glycosyltransferase involved in cell wall biosynthesis